jgi:outer membrane biosynthesis protein TonB
VKESPEPEEPPKPAPPERSEEGKEKPEEPEKPVDPTQPASPAPQSPQSPGFRGNQKKTRLEGSISRLGRSALDVEDSALGRYHAAVSRAVEKEWQRNCVRNRDYITPGQLTMRVMLEASGKVRSVGFMEEFGVGNIPKGFTLNSIRDAEIPAMPGELKKQLDGEPLELIYRFNF